MAWTKTAIFGLCVAVGACNRGGGDGDDGAEDSGTGGTGQGSDGSGDETGSPVECEELSVGGAPLKRITRDQYANVVQDLLGVAAGVDSLEPDERVGPFHHNTSAPVSSASVESYRALAEEVAASAVESLGKFLPCDPSAGAACTRQFIEGFGRPLFRRSLASDEVDAWAGLAATGEDFTDGIRLAISGMLQSPHFLYHFEFGLPDPGGGDVQELTQYELASRLSFFLWNTAPDVALLDAAEAGELATLEGLRTQADRLLLDGRARDAVADFHVQWLELDELSELLKDDAVYPEYDDALRDAMLAETRRFSSLVVLQGDGRLESLFTAPYSYVDGPLFDLYGISTPPDHSPGQPVDLPAERAGLLTQASFLTTHAHSNSSGPIQRGVVVRTNLLCDPPPPPPPEVMVVPPEPDPEATTREIFEEHTKNPACASCHVLIDGLGLGFEGYDGVGRYRTTENGLPVDESGDLVGTDVDGPFNGPVELAQRLAQSQNVRECVSKQWFRFAYGRIESEADECSMDVLNEAFAQSDYNVRELLLTIVETDAFRYRLKD